MFDESKPHHWNPSARLPVLNPTESEVRDAIAAIVAYNWGDEIRDFDENPHEEHPYLALRVLHAHLYRKP